MLSIKLFWLSSVCLCSIETSKLRFGIEAKQPKQTISKQTKTNQKNRENPKFSEKIPKYAPYQTVWIGLLFISPKHRKSLFRYKVKQLKQTFCFG
jgi:hypothetical protein